MRQGANDATCSVLQENQVTCGSEPPRRFQVQLRHGFRVTRATEKMRQKQGFIRGRFQQPGFG